MFELTDRNSQSRITELLRELGYPEDESGRQALERNLQRLPGNYARAVVDSLNGEARESEKLLDYNRKSFPAALRRGKTLLRHLGRRSALAPPGGARAFVCGTLASPTIEQLDRALTPRQRAAVTVLWGLDGTGKKSLRKAGRLLGISGERVRQLELRAIFNLEKANRESEKESPNGHNGHEVFDGHSKR